MTSKMFTFLVFGVLTLGVLLGFTGSNDNPKNLSTRSSNFNNPMVTYGPALDNPSSTLNESFEGATFPPAGWIKLSPDGGTGWSRQTVGTTPMPGWDGGVITAPPNGGNAVAYATWNSGGAVGNNQWIVTPQLTGSTVNDSLSFWLRFWPSNVYSDTVSVRISTTTPTIGGFTTNVATIPFPRNSPDTNWTQYKYPIGTMIPAGSSYYIAFIERVNDNLNDGASVSLDLVSVTSSGGPPPSCTYTYTPQTSGVTTVMYSVSAVSDMVGWVGGAAGSVRRTTDGGTSWTNGNPSPGVISGDIYNIYAWSANDALCTTSPAATNIYKTSNGGTTWTQVYTLAGGFINAIQMLNTTEGYAEGDPVGGKWTILKTTDGGNSWARMATEPVQVGTEAGWNNSFQVLGTNIWFGTNNTKVYHSSDLGATWSSAAATGSANTYATHFNSATNGLAGGTAMVKTVDGGTTYTVATSPGTSGNISGITGIGSDWWAVRTGTDIYRSVNQGTNWTSASTIAGAAYNDVTVTDNSGCASGWAVGTGTITKIKGTFVGINNYSSEIPESFNLQQNYPNPFNPTTNINFSIPNSGFVTLKIYNMAGMEVAKLLSENKTAGSYTIGFNAANLPSGAYFYRLETNSFSDTKKMILIK